MSRPTNNMSEELFKVDGKTSVGETLPLALQHVVAMIVGCVTPAIIVAGVAGLSTRFCYFNSGSPYDVSNYNIDSGIPSPSDRENCNRFWTSGNHGYQFCLCTDYAGNCRKI